MNGYTIFQTVLGVCGKINMEMAILILKVGESMMSLARGCPREKGMKRGMPEERNRSLV